MGGPTIPFSERVYVTITRGGAIFLNRKAHKMMGDPMAVYLYYNRPKDMIILEPTSALTASNAFLFRDAGSNSSGRTIYARPFCMHFGIRPDNIQKFLDPEVDSVGRMYLKLSETVNVARGPRISKKKSR